MVTTPDVANLGLVRPPIVYFSAVVMGLVLESVWPSPFLPRGLAAPLGGLLLLAGAVLFVSAVRTFGAAGTPVPGNAATTTIVRTGPYRFTRNPIYVGFSTMHLGIACWVNGAWLVATLGVAVVLMAFVVIPREEHYLERKFGTAYLDYKSSVRRWF
jgi:protein-S-isoprenylcysteine O-methyltransferase Ste14